VGMWLMTKTISEQREHRIKQNLIHLSGFTEQ
jgi:hypothetical protein